ncbi:LuxR C-terminal-related transcriptional regulator [Bacteroidota bacterium]
MNVYFRNTAFQKITYTKYIYILIILICYSKVLLSIDLQSITTPSIVNYTWKEYQGSSQVWGITQDQNQIMWFGNNGCVLWHDGLEWGRVDIPNGSIVRCLNTVSDNSILAGAFGDFGQINRDNYGQYSFESWLEKVPMEYRNFNEVWRIHELNNIIYIQSKEIILKFRDKKFIGALEPDNQFRFSFLSGGRLYVEEVGEGLKVYLNDQLTLLEKGAFFQNKEVWYVGHWFGRLLVITQNEGAFVYENGTWKMWSTEVNSLLKDYGLFSTHQHGNEGFIFGTVQGGMLITDSEGTVQHTINIKRGLQNNTVLNVYTDNMDNIWLGLDKGISLLKKSDPFSILIKEDGFGTGYAAIEFEDRIYLGTNDGLYTFSDEANDFILVENSRGQVWSLKIINNELYCCHDNGLFRVRENVAEKVFNIEGVWNLLEVPGEDFYISGTYYGLYKIEIKNSARAVKITGFNESSRIMEFDDENKLWMSHGYEGVFRLNINSDFTRTESVLNFGPQQGLPSRINNEVFKFNDKIIIAAEDGFYIYNDVIGLMLPYERWNKLLKLDHPVSKIQQDPWGRIYFFNASKLTWAIIKDDSLMHIDSTSFLPLRNDFFAAYENIYFTSKETAILGTVEGFSVYNRDRTMGENKELPFFIKRINSGIREGGNNHKISLPINTDQYRLPYHQNNLFIELSYPVYTNNEDIVISCSVDGKLLPDVIDNNQVFLKDLSHGLHQINIQARSLASNYQSDLIQMSVNVLPPWYFRWYSFFAVGGLIIVLVLFARRYYLKKLESIRKREEISLGKKMKEKQEALRLQAEKAEKELIIIRNEQLKSLNRRKAEEIANSTMELVHKNKMLLTVKETLELIQKERDIEIRNIRIKDLLKKIDRDLNNEENWKIFEQNFYEVHENFLNTIKEKHPSLTSKDLRLCAYLKMNLSSKEIAPLLRISSRSVEISRYRLRKKMNLGHNTNLTDYLHSI